MNFKKLFIFNLILKIITKALNYLSSINDFILIICLLAIYIIQCYFKYLFRKWKYQSKNQYNSYKHILCIHRLFLLQNYYLINTN